MMENELLFLGLLKDSPKHGYEIKRLIKKNIFPFIKIDSTSIYYPLKKLEKKGLITKSASKAGRRPEKFTYQLTSKGENRFNELLEQSLVTIERPFFNIDLALYFISYLRPAQAKRRLSIRLNLLRKLENQILNLRRNFKTSDPNLTSILKHNFNLLKAEIDSLSDLLSSIS